MKKEIKEIQVDIDKTISEEKTTDIVKASDKEFPFTEHLLSVSGCNDFTNRELYLLKLKKQQKIQELYDMKLEIENFIYSIEDSHLRRIFRLKYIDGLSWQGVARVVGGNNTRDSVRKATARYLKKYFQKN